MSNSLDLDQVEKNVRSDLDPNSLQRLSADNRSQQSISHEYENALHIVTYMLKLCFNVRPSEYDQKSTFTDYKPECASVITSLNACNGYFVLSPNGSNIG